MPDGKERAEAKRGARRRIDCLLTTESGIRKAEETQLPPGFWLRLLVDGTAASFKWKTLEEGEVEGWMRGV